MVEAAGFTPMEAIEAGTRNGAAALGLSTSRGTVGPGKLADLVVLDANPLADTHDTTRIRMTVVRGRVVHPQ